MTQVYADEDAINMLFTEIRTLRSVTESMAKALMNPGDEKLRVLALAHYEQTFRGAGK